MSEPEYRDKVTVWDVYAGLVLAPFWWLSILGSGFFLMCALASQIDLWWVRAMCLGLYLVLARLSLLLRRALQYPERIA
jgi:lipid-A-disaccharide synthase-like uncharacterized protein